MEVIAKIIQIPVRSVPEAEFYHPGAQGHPALTHGNTNIGPLHLYGLYKERLALMQWAMRGRRRQQDQATC
ncbi:MAG: hypothetical protein O7B79_06305 [SAR324 cluster bacterium]|nr:hypothetical protein [SAR324 cluster bacterium]